MSDYLTGTLRKDVKGKYWIDSDCFVFMVPLAVVQSLDIGNARAYELVGKQVEFTLEPFLEENQFAGKNYHRIVDQIKGLHNG